MTMAATSRMMLYHLAVTKPPKAANAPPMAPMAKPMAAKIPANLAMSNICAFLSSALLSTGASPSLAAATLVWNSVVPASALAVISSNCLLSFSAALLVILSVTHWPNLR